jgi:hypothetical protein
MAPRRKIVCIVFALIDAVLDDRPVKNSMC